ncbi:hypothetical protein NMY22_g853 [Coprinellus aureogranulatus]|nr:hypothetical protein NMY22_g853 [Coprinellus aureogranulatus]
MEVHLHVSTAEKLAGVDSVAIFSLAINHKHCVASYTIGEIVEPAVLYLDPRRQNRSRRLYWNYLWNHPTHTPTPSQAISDAADALTWFYTDNMISGMRSIAPFSKIECDEISSRLKDLSLPHHTSSVAKTVFLAWFLREVCSFRDAESYGVYTYKESQQIRQERIAAQKPPVSLEQSSPYSFMFLNLFINMVFFGIPRTYWTTSEFRGRLSAVQQNWVNYIDRLVREYTHFLLISTVLLSATVGFLSIDELSEGARLAASVAALTSMSSIIIGVFSIWRHQANTTTKHSYTYMHNVQNSAFGVPGHAILLSLPPTLLVWSIVAFTVAILAYIAQGATSGDQWNRTSAATLLAPSTGFKSGRSKHHTMRLRTSRDRILSTQGSAPFLQVILHPTMPPPTYLYKIVPATAAPPDPLPEWLPVSDLDAKDGFVHLSTAKQVPGTLNLFFDGHDKIYLLRLEYAKVKEQIKWETPQRALGKEGEDGCFPHLYNGNRLGKNEVDSVSSVEKAKAETWDLALSPLVSRGWLS